MMDDGRRTADGGRWTADGRRQTADGGRRTAEDRRRTADGGLWFVVCGPWRLIRRTLEEDIIWS
jgi:hypothetical protein